VTRWITPSLATAAFDSRPAAEHGQVIDVRDLLDKAGNAPELVRAKIEAALVVLRAGGKVVVCCDYGLSRSNAVAAGVLAAHESVPFDSAVRRVLDATDRSPMRVEVLSVVRAALGGDDRAPVRADGDGPLLVTGGTGFLGRVLVPALSARVETVSPGRGDIDLERDAVALDLLVRERRIRTLLHLANPRVYTTAASLGATLTMLKNVLSVCVENGVFLIFLSGWEVFSGYRAAALVADESLAVRPGDSYGQAKFLCEQLIDVHRDRGLESLILRSSPVYGPDSDRPKFIWNFLAKAARNEEIATHVYRNGPPRLDLLHQDDLREAVLAAVTLRPRGLLHLGTGVATSTADIAAFFVRQLGSRSTVVHRHVAADTANVVMDGRRAEAILGFRAAIDVWPGLEGLLRSRHPERPIGTAAGREERE
jgi:nucleoside-diphosphate-sugar epimerase